MTDTLVPSAIDLQPFADVIDNAATDEHPCVMASYDEGHPDIAMKGSMMVLDRDHLAYWDRGGGETLVKLRKRSQVCVFVRNPVRDPRQIRLYGDASVVTDPELGARIWERVVGNEKERDLERKGVPVIIRVDRLRTGGKPPLDVRRT